MREWTDTALVLRVGHFREIDLWLKLLLPSRGIITALAFGGAKSRRRFCGCLDVLNTLTCRFRESRLGRALTLEEATLKAGPQLLRYDYQRLGLASNCLRFVEALGLEESNPALFAFMEDLRQ
ncbi:MAG: recombination protein O N-terminal domain-containing protein, partial [Desulfovibrio sp.]|nr:recombination protein O N-terminal domain-containing protein [Desulfovibrio sp.]